MAIPFQLISEFTPSGDQPDAIDKLVLGIEEGIRDQVLLGVTGSGKIPAGHNSDCAVGRNG